jgi:hypothetical protein
MAMTRSTSSWRNTGKWTGNARSPQKALCIGQICVGAVLERLAAAHLKFKEDLQLFYSGMGTSVEEIKVRLPSVAENGDDPIDVLLAEHREVDGERAFAAEGSVHRKRTSSSFIQGWARQSRRSRCAFRLA